MIYATVTTCTLTKWHKYTRTPCHPKSWLCRVRDTGLTSMMSTTPVGRERAPCVRAMSNFHANWGNSANKDKSVAIQSARASGWHSIQESSLPASVINEWGVAYYLQVAAVSERTQVSFQGITPSIRFSTEAANVLPKVRMEARPMPEPISLPSERFYAVVAFQWRPRLSSSVWGPLALLI